MLDRLIDHLDPYLSKALWILVFAPILERFRWIARTKEAQASLHSALQTGVDKVTDLLVSVVLANPIGFKLDQYAGQVADHVFDSVPGALKFLLGKPWFWRMLGRRPMTPAQQRAWIEGMATAKLNKWAADFLARLRPDELTKALRDAGVDAVSSPRPL